MIPLNSKDREFPRTKKTETSQYQPVYIRNSRTKTILAVVIALVIIGAGIWAFYSILA